MRRSPRRKTSLVTPRSSSSRTATRKNCCTKPRLWPPSTVLNWSSHRSKRSSFRLWEARQMHNILLIARREYLEKIRGRAFKISTVLVPVLAVALQGVGYLTNRTARSGDHVAIAAQNAVLAAEVRRQMLKDMDAKSTVDVVAPATRQDRDALLKLVQTKAIDGVLVIDTSSAGDATATYTSQSPGSF